MSYFVAEAIKERLLEISEDKEVTAKSPYTPVEWAKIEKLASAKGKIYKSAKEAKKHIESL